MDINLQQKNMASSYLNDFHMNFKKNTPRKFFLNKSRHD